MTTMSLAFNGTELSPVNHNNQIWLSAVELAKALGYSRSDEISRIFRRNEDEFTGKMTAVIRERQNGVLEEINGLQVEKRIFSLRGCHLLAMFSRTEIAKEFRKWVLDILDKEVETQYGLKTYPTLPAPRAKKAIKGGLLLEQQDTINDMIKDRLLLVPQDRKAAMAIRIYSALNTKFETRGMKDGYKNIAPEHFDNIIQLIARLPLDGELLPKTEQFKLEFTPEELEDLVSERIKAVETELAPKKPSGNSVTINLAPLSTEGMNRWIISQYGDNGVEMHMLDPMMIISTREETIDDLRQEGYIVFKKKELLGRLMA